MHRSGTSLITQWLQACGLHIGDNLLGAETGNEQGHFEDVDFVNVHRQLLAKSRLPENGLTECRNIELLQADALQISNLIKSKNEKYAQWAWKDPRTCLFLQPYRQIMPNAFYLVILRDYQSVVSSLLNRDNKGLQRYYKSKGRVYRIFLRMKRKYNTKWLYKTYAERYLSIWISYNQALLHHIKALPKNNIIVIDYHSLLNSDKPFFTQIAGQGFNLTYVKFSSIYNSNLISKPVDIANLVKNSGLLNKADRLQKELYSLLYKL